MSRKNFNTTLNEDLYYKIQILTIQLSAKKGKKINANDLLEEGMQLVLEKYEKEEDPKK